VIHWRETSDWLDVLKWKGVVSLSGAEEFDRSAFVEFCRGIGECNTPNHYFNDPDFPEIFRVTGETKNGKPIGMFADGDLGWHSNGSSRKTTKHIVVALYCVESSGQVQTEWCDLARGFEDLSQQRRAWLRQIEIEVGPQRNTFYKNGENEFKVLDQQTNGWKPLVQIHPFFERECCLYHHLFIRSIRSRESGQSIDIKKFVTELNSHFFQKQYRTSFTLRPGDLILSDQLLTVHRRGAFAGERLLYRAAFDYSKIREKFYGNTFRAH
jgi:taurine dioxygenase